MMPAVKVRLEGGELTHIHPGEAAARAVHDEVKRSKHLCRRGKTPATQHYGGVVLR